jgi:RNA polymerase sigma factor (sigma-70 family)
VDRKQERAFEEFVAESGDTLLRLVALRYFDDRSENEVAELLGVSPGTVKSTASRAMAQLRVQPGISGLFAAARTDTTIRKVRYA